MELFQPGTIVNARGREWIVLPESTSEVLHLRGLGASENDKVLIYVPLESEKPRHAQFPLPNAQYSGISIAAQTLKDSLLLKLRHGSGPFRSFGNIAIEPRPYQLVPLMMALKLPVVRLLIADDVGVGKTIEAGLIVRELLDRGEIEGFTVLCPPHLCDQWKSELYKKFHIDAEIVNTITAKKLEKNLPPGKSIFEVYPFTIVSLDYVKSQRRRDEFIRSSPACMIVDEAHSCVLKSQGRHQRYELLNGLAQNSDRHLILLTATPHSGDEDGFYNLLGLIKPEFEKLKEIEEAERSADHPLRQDLANHFVQRRRPDIEEWQDQSVFPVRETPEYDVTYSLDGEWGKLFSEIKKYAKDIISSAEEGSKRKQRLNWWAALALLRCASSSPAAAEVSLSSRLARRDSNLTDTDWENLEEHLKAKILDGVGDDVETIDFEPGILEEDTSKLQKLVVLAKKLRGVKTDPKLAKLVSLLDDLLGSDYKPVVFCRYIATAHYLVDELKIKYPDYQIVAVTGSFVASEREELVSSLEDYDKKILVATDCLSEGINLQDQFNSVVHYDLSWNPTRHEQREGRVDRFGQKSKKVRMAMIHGKNNPIDDAVLNVIIKKAEKIKKELGVMVPLPDDDLRITENFLKKILLADVSEQIEMFEDNNQAQLSMFLKDTGIEKAWIDTQEKVKKTRTVFAQNKLRPDDVIPEWKKILSLMGSEADVERFAKRALSILNFNLILDNKRGYDFNPSEIENSSVREELMSIGFKTRRFIDFSYPPRPKSEFIHRTHPLVSVLSNYILEKALETEDERVVSRSGAIITDNVQIRTVVYLVRLRMKIRENIRGQERQLMAEEALLISTSDYKTFNPLEATEGRDLLESVAKGNLSDKARIREVEAGISSWEDAKQFVDELAKSKSKLLLEDHRRVRTASKSVGKYDVEAILPVDLIGIFVYLPQN